MTNSPAMNFDEVKALKAELVNDIENLLMQFTDATGMSVERVCIDNHLALGSRLPLYIVGVEVRL